MTEGYKFSRLAAESLPPCDILKGERILHYTGFKLSSGRLDIFARIKSAENAKIHPHCDTYLSILQYLVTLRSRVTTSVILWGPQDVGSGNVVNVNEYTMR